jgi:Zn-finger nucleic acid-binding protein
MNCPHCTDTVLVMTERQGVEIDYCPRCRGVWLDRGELDKLIERAGRDAGAAPAAAAAQPVSPPAAAAQPPAHAAPYPAHRDFDDSDYPRSWAPSHGTPVRKRKSLLRDIFDFD